MSNTYYKYKKKDKDAGILVDSYISISAQNPDNDIVLAIFQGNAGGGATYGQITLNEQEQDDLIAGILERRGWKVQLLEDSEYGVEMEAYNTNDSISATGNKQSKIWPANKE